MLCNWKNVVVGGTNNKYGKPVRDIAPPSEELIKVQNRNTKSVEDTSSPVEVHGAKDEEEPDDISLSSEAPTSVYKPNNYEVQVQDEPPQIEGAMVVCGADDEEALFHDASPFPTLVDTEVHENNNDGEKGWDMISSVGPGELHESHNDEKVIQEMTCDSLEGSLEVNKTNSDEGLFQYAHTHELNDDEVSVRSTVSIVSSIVTDIIPFETYN